MNKDKGEIGDITRTFEYLKSPSSQSYLPKDCMECKHAPCYFQSCPYAWYEHKQRRVTKK
jgi:radical SAM protein with 4Fe4S-binding SPASM domain